MSERVQVGTPCVIRIPKELKGTPLDVMERWTGAIVVREEYRNDDGDGPWMDVQVCAGHILQLAADWVHRAP